ncbi:hybrid histidine kinase [Calothrix sp. NIES-4071]|nr:hybrid histidine kinase [Calothrix sp. NIES-4071]BAZ56643.1 hybrid histidine kinase [Calothrix sp. NIES-4105]
MQQYSGIPEHNSQVDATSTLLTEIEHLRDQLWLESSLNELQSQLNECLTDFSNNLQYLESKIFKTVVDQLGLALKSSQVGIALAQTDEAAAKLCYVSMAPGSENAQVKYLKLEQVISTLELKSLSTKQRAFPITANQDNAPAGWLIIIPDPIAYGIKETINRKACKEQLLKSAVERCAAALTQVRQLQSLEQDYQDLKNYNQELQRTNQLKNQFLASTSHEIRTPLSSILGFTHLLLAQGFDPSRERHKEYLSIIQSSGKHLLALINDILDLSKIEANQMEVQWETVDIPAISRTVFALIKEKAANKGLKMVLDLDPDVTTIIADSLRLKQMLLNLLFNALKFTKSGSVGLQVRKINDYVHFVVWDTGTGIPEEYQGELFQPFSQIANTLVGRDEGTGLGLAVTRKLAELHNGYVEVESKINEGSRFVVVLPMKQSIDIKDAETKNIKNQIIEVEYPNCPIPEIISSSNAACILIVEDDVPNAKMMQIYLGKLGHKVDWVKNSTQLWEILQQHCPSIILLDIYLPDCDGFNLIKQLRGNGQYKDIIIIAQTAMAMKGDRETCIAAGFDDYICKPIDLPLLASLISKYS